MTRVGIHVRFFAPFAAFVVLAALLDANFRMQLRRLPPNVAAYVTPYIVANPTAQLLDDEIASRVARFTHADTVMVLGNSVAWGAGARDRLHLARAMAGRGNVVMAAVSGGRLADTTALAVYAADKTLERLPATRLRIVLVFPLSVLFPAPDYFSLGEPFARICEAEPSLAPYIPDCAGLLRQFASARRLDDVRQRVIRGSPCQINPDLVLSWAASASINCESFLGQSSSSAEFVSGYEGRTGVMGHDPAATAQYFAAAVAWLRVPERRQAYLSVLTTMVDHLTRYLDARGASYTVEFLALTEAPAVLHAISTDALSAFDAGTDRFVGELRGTRPRWNVVRVPPFEDGDYLDIVHLRESGQEKLATQILSRVP